jgi:hypothetical protein
LPFFARILEKETWTILPMFVDFTTANRAHVKTIALDRKVPKLSDILEDVLLNGFDAKLSTRSKN